MFNNNSNVYDMCCYLCRVSNNGLKQSQKAELVYVLVILIVCMMIIHGTYLYTKTKYKVLHSLTNME